MEKINDELMQDKINALVDGRLPADQQADTQARLALNADAQETLHAWQAQREALRALHCSLLDEAIPETLLAAARRGQKSRQQLDQWWRWGGLAAAVVLAFGVGWLSHDELGGAATRKMAAAGQTRSTQAFVHQASLAYAVYSPEVRHPVEVTAAQQDHLVQWLSKRLDRPLKVPVLATRGYELVGGRLLPGEGGARAQFMFQNLAGARVTLYLGRVDGSAPTNGSPGNDAAPKMSGTETAFRYSGDGPVPSFYWVDQGFGYALSGALSQAELMQLAELVYRQL
ncbi:anti-sigma factor [Polaromonas sp.]|uniref:anti-sigma factor family protein n=1 Tax=Polaromonas sp. TaxID=1869339 RepID=UPI00184BA2FB|nr:anti-sigma factor [Polaromonas sp.]NML84679.1 anti-sigma factor [Polaromonas sp.]